MACAGAFREATAQPAVVDGAYIRQWIHMRYKACQFRRYMSESDMSVRPWLQKLSATLIEVEELQ